MIEKLKQQIIENQFVHLIRTEMKFDDGEYAALRTQLVQLGDVLHIQDSIDKELALILYCIPQWVRNAYLSFDARGVSRPSIVEKLEDAWIALDQLVIDCLKQNP